MNNTTAALSPAQMQEISEAFALFDNDKDNRLSPYEFKVFLSNKLLSCFFRLFEVALIALGFELKQPEIEELLESVDLTPSDKVPFKEFFAMG